MRRKRVIEGFQSAAETIGPVTPGLSLFAVTRGQFSMIDIAAAVLQSGMDVVCRSVRGPGVHGVFW